MPDRAIRLVIIGKVQGVGFRAWVEDAARARGLRGWVRNRRDGSVEAMLAGDADAIAQIAKACETGPRLATVFHVDTVEHDGPVPSRFSVLPTE